MCKYENGLGDLINDNQDYLENENGSPKEGDQNKDHVSGFKDIHNHKKQYVVQIISEFGITIGIVSQILSYDIKNEFDPLMIERMKNCMKQLLDKGFIKDLKDEILANSTIMCAESRQTLLDQVQERENQQTTEENQ